MKRNTLILVILFVVGLEIITFLSLKNYQEIPIHWGINGNVDQYGSKIWLHIFEIFPLVLYLLMSKYNNVKSDNIEEIKAFNSLKMIIVTFFGTINIIILVLVLHPTLNVGLMFSIPLGLLLIGIGNLFEKFEPNKYIGIRNRYTLSDKTVWYKTHRLSRKIFMGFGIIIIISSFFNYELIGLLGFFIGVIIIYIYSKKISK